MTTATKVSKHHIYGILKNYHWITKEVQRIENELKGTEFAGCAQYGIEATMPKPQGTVSKALESEVMRRLEKSKRHNKYLEDINFIIERFGAVTNEREKVVLDCLLDGMSLTAISKHLGLTRNTVHEIRDSVVDKLAK